jgi:hypothetical protein
MGNLLEEQILANLRQGLHRRLGDLDETEAAHLDPSWVAEAMLSAIPTRHPFEGLGPFYDTAGLVEWLGVTRQALSQRVKARQLLAAPLSDGHLVYPVWQFTPEGRTLNGLGDVLRILLEATDPWTATIWLTTPSERLDYLRAVDVLRKSPDHRRVLEAAAEDARRWSQ